MAKVGKGFTLPADRGKREVDSKEMHKRTKDMKAKGYLGESGKKKVEGKVDEKSERVLRKGK